MDRPGQSGREEPSSHLRRTATSSQRAVGSFFLSVPADPRSLKMKIDSNFMTSHKRGSLPSLGGHAKNTNWFCQNSPTESVWCFDSPAPFTPIFGSSRARASPDPFLPSRASQQPRGKQNIKKSITADHLCGPPGSQMPDRD